MKRSDFDNLIQQTNVVFDECQKKFYEADRKYRECNTDYDRAAKQLVKDIHFHRQDAAFCALNALTTARDILNHLGYIEED